MKKYIYLRKTFFICFKNSLDNSFTINIFCCVKQKIFQFVKLVKNLKDRCMSFKKQQIFY